MATTIQDPLAEALRDAEAGRQSEAADRADHEQFLWATYAASLQDRTTPEHGEWFGDAIDALGITAEQIQADKQLIAAANERAGYAADAAAARASEKLCELACDQAAHAFRVALMIHNVARGYADTCQKLAAGESQLHRERPLLAKHAQLSPFNSSRPDLPALKAEFEAAGTCKAVANMMRRDCRRFSRRPGRLPA